MCSPSASYPAWTCWSSAGVRPARSSSSIPKLNVIGVEFVAYDSFKANTVVSDYIDRYGTHRRGLDGCRRHRRVHPRGLQGCRRSLPKVMVGEDQQDYLQYWKDNNLTAIAPTFPTFQWRTAVLASVMFLQGETVQHNWVLPQPDVTQANLDQVPQPGDAPAALHPVRLRGHDELPGCLEERRRQQVQGRPVTLGIQRLSKKWARSNFGRAHFKPVALTRKGVWNP